MSVIRFIDILDAEILIIEKTLLTGDLNRH